MDRQRRKQAEFLVHRSCPWELVTEIGVYNEADTTSSRRRADRRVAFGGTVPIRVRTEWYY